MRLTELWQKLALGFVAVAAVAILISYLLVNYAVTRRFEGYVSEKQRLSYQRIGESLALTYIENKGWPRALWQQLPHYAVMSGVQIKVLDARGRKLAETPDNMGDMMEQMMTGEPMGSQAELPVTMPTVEVPIVAHRSRVGTVRITPLVQPQNLLADLRFRQSINSSLILGGLVAALAALGLSFLISTRLTQPLATIMRAAKKMEQGELGAQVEVATRDEIGQLAEAFNHLSLALKRQEELRKNLTADIAHELRTPLATMQSHVEAYVDGIIEPDKRNLESMHEEILRLKRLVDHLGELARVESGQVALVRAPVDLNETATKVTDSLRPLFEEKSVALEVDGAPGKLICRVDEDKIRQVLFNLLSNALKFTPSGGRAWLRLSSKNGQAVMLVGDTGIGISADHLPLIFERFYRIEKSRNRTTGGSGIGLTVAKQLVEAHGGRLDAKSALEHGSEFTVRLPLIKNA